MLKAFHGSHSSFGLRAILMMACASCWLVGCAPAPPPDGILAIENVAKWYQLYRADHRGKAPADEDVLFEFIEKRLAERDDSVTREELFTSPRDGQRYVVQYGDKANSKDMEINVAVIEQTGYEGIKLMAFESARAREVDEAELQQLLAEE